MTEVAATEIGSSKPSAGRTARTWFDWHSWLGVMTGLLLFIICWSGAFATLSHEIDWLVNPVLRVTPGGEAADLAAIHDAVKAVMPEAAIVVAIKPLYDNFAADVVVTTSDKETRHVYVDPYTLEVTGSASYFNVQRFFREFHRSFFGFYGAGIYLVCAFAVPLIGSLITGLLFYRRWWRRFFDIRIGRGARTFWSGAHKVTGLWSLWFVVVIAGTGAWYLVEQVRFHLVDGKFAYVDSFPLAIKPLPPLEIEGEDILSVAALTGRAQAARPDLEIRKIFPDRNGYFYVVGQAEHVLVRDRANKLFLDPRDGRIVYEQKAEDLSPYWRWSNTADPLHFGTFGGLVSKLIWFVFGLGLAGLSLTGAWLHLKRRQRDDHGHVYRRGSVTVGFLSVMVPLLSAPIPFVLLKRVGPLVDGVRVAPDIPTGVAAFIVSWVLMTLAIAVIWLIALVNSRQRMHCTRRRRTGAASLRRS